MYREKKSNPWSKLIVILLIAGSGYVAWRYLPEPIPPVVIEQSTPLPDPDETPKIEFPLADVPSPAPESSDLAQLEAKKPVVPLPTLESSDEPLLQEFTGLFDRDLFARLFVLKGIVHRIVVTVDNLPQAKIPSKYVITAPIDGDFEVQTDIHEKTYIAVANYRRYEDFINFIDAVDNQSVINVYVRYYTLFQEAYENLGYPNKYFNDRLIHVIDHMIEAPHVSGPVELIRPGVFYKFADERVEKLSAGHKLMVRIGPDNAEKIKNKLREFKKQLIAASLRRKKK